MSCIARLRSTARPNGRLSNCPLFPLLDAVHAQTLAARPQVNAYLDRFLALPEVVSFRASPIFMASPINNKVAFVNNM